MTKTACIAEILTYCLSDEERMRKGLVVLCLILLFTAGLFTHVSGTGNLLSSLIEIYNNLLLLPVIATLEPSISASVNEGGELQVCVSLDPPATGNTIVTVATSVETATGGTENPPVAFLNFSAIMVPCIILGLDFTPLDEDILFTMGEVRRCATTNISIPTDNIVESVETFNVRISSNDVPISPISTIATRVNIGDRSRKPTKYYVCRQS